MRRALIALFAASSFGCTDSGPAVATNFDLASFQGHWYEISRVPRDYDTDCRDTVADYEMTGASQMQMRHSCFLGSGTGNQQEFQAVASVEDPSVPAKLTLQIGSYSADYWVLDTGNDYDYAVVGHPSRTMLWILSRTPTLADASYSRALTLAQNRGFDVSQLAKTPQSEP
ncbi:MAG TPA: lipocalin family protein [Polyangiaceae bacterium]|jgi:apolipoprotein D and lipocalin family protein|nr:lipocalin family protein [Polyangiaceae bacterium]